MGQCGVRISPPAPQSTWPCPVKQTTLHTLTWVTLSQSQTQLVRLKGMKWPASHGLATPLQQWHVCLAKESPLALVQGAAADPDVGAPMDRGLPPDSPPESQSSPRPQHPSLLPGPSHRPLSKCPCPAVQSTSYPKAWFRGRSRGWTAEAQGGWWHFKPLSSWCPWGPTWRVHRGWEVL